MNVYTHQLKQSIREKIDRIDDADYLSSLDAVLTYETYGMNGLNGLNEKRKPLQKSFWKRLWLPAPGKIDSVGTALMFALPWFFIRAIILRERTNCFHVFCQIFPNTYSLSVHNFSVVLYVWQRMKC